MTLGALDVAVIGAGTAGSAAALLLARAGHAVTLFEAVLEPKPVGAGIMLQPTGMHVLAELGLLEPILARGARVDRLHCVTRGRRAVIDLAYADVHRDAFGVGLHRGVLFQTLIGAVQKDPRIRLELGRGVEAIEPEGGGRVLRADGARAGRFDLVVVADGARSTLRAQTGLVKRATEYPWGALWLIARDPDHRFDGTLFQVVEGTTRMLGLLPSGLGPEGDVAQVSLFWSLRADRLGAWREAGLAPWKALLRELEPRSASLLEQVSAPEEVLFARYWDVVLGPWHQGAVVVIGDAAHATSPQLGQGANLGLWDAWELSLALSGAISVEQGLARYSRGRRAHLGYYQWATRVLTPFFQSDAAPLGWLRGLLRDAAMGLACKLPYVRTRMIRTMCGLDRGVLFAGALPMPRAPRLLTSESAD